MSHLNSSRITITSEVFILSPSSEYRQVQNAVLDKSSTQVVPSQFEKGLDMTRMMLYRQGL